MDRPAGRYVPVGAGVEACMASSGQPYTFS